MISVIVSAGQSLFDLALQECGAVDAAFNLADANGLSITDQLTPGQVLTVPTSAVARPQMVAYYAGRGHHVNTGSTVSAALDQQGIFDSTYDQTFN